MTKGAPKFIVRANTRNTRGEIRDFGRLTPFINTVKNKKGGAHEERLIFV